VLIIREKSFENFQSKHKQKKEEDVAAIAIFFARKITEMGARSGQRNAKLQGRVQEE
jgi:hypothetical protein